MAWLKQQLQQLASKQQLSQEQLTFLFHPCTRTPGWAGCVCAQSARGANAESARRGSLGNALILHLHGAGAELGWSKPTDTQL